MAASIPPSTPNTHGPVGHAGVPRVHSRLLVIAFINNFLDGHFPFLKAHRLFLLEFGTARFDRRDETKRLY